MQQRSTGISRRVHALPPGPRRDQALDQLWRGQCNCPYWHGVFGGIYLYHIRHATFSHLVAADALATGDAESGVTLERADFDADGHEECRLSTTEQSVFVHSRGGAVFEWDVPEIPLNLLNALAAHSESYAVQVEPGSRIRLRRAFVDHLLDSAPSASDVVADRWQDQLDLAAEPWRLEGAVEGQSGRVTATCSATVAGGAAALSLTKTYRLRPGDQCFTTEYIIDGVGSLPAGSWLAVEVSLALPPGAHTLGALACQGNRFQLTETWEGDGVTEFDLHAPGLAIGVSLSQPARLVEHPLWSRHRTELGEEKVYQGTRVVLIWPLAAEEGDTWRTETMLSWSTSAGS